MEKDTDASKPIPLWRNRDYLLLWLGQAVSSLGTGISQVAFPLLLLALTNSPAAAGFAFGLGQLPYVLFSLPAGALVDRWNRKRVMIVCTIGLALCLAAIPFALLLGLRGPLLLFLLYLVSFAIGMLTVFYGLAELASLTRVVPKAQLTLAVTQNEVAFSTVSLLAPPIGILLFSMRWILPFLADVVSYLLLLGMLFRIRTSLQRERQKAPSHLFIEVREGMRWLWSHPVLRPLAFLAGYLEVILSANLLIVLVIARHYAISPGFTAVIIAAGGIGNLLGTALVAPLQRRVRFGRALLSLLILFVLLWPLYSLATVPGFLTVVVAGLAMIDTISFVLIASYRLAIIPDELQGRVGSVYRLIVFGFVTVGPTLIGICLQRFGVVATLGILWWGFTLFAVLVLVNSQVRRATFPDEEVISGDYP